MSIVAKQLDGLRYATWYGGGLGPGDFVRWGPGSPRHKRHRPHPIFGPCLLSPNGWMDEDATCTSRPWPRPHCVRREPSSPAKGAQPPPPFRPMSIVATVAYLSYCWAVVYLIKLQILWNKTGISFFFLLHLWQATDIKLIASVCSALNLWIKFWYLLF